MIENILSKNNTKFELEVLGSSVNGQERVLSPEALKFLEALDAHFGLRRLELLQLRKERQSHIDSGVLPDLISETRVVRDGDWRVAEIPADLLDRRVEITGPVDRKMIINALNSGAKMFMADFEDATSPTWENLISGQANLMDYADNSLSYADPKNNKVYSLNQDTAVLMVRPRGWHLEEAHIQVGGRVISASLFDFGLYFFHNARKLVERGTGPYFYLPKLESHLEARLWNDVFVFAQDYIGLPLGTIKATVLIETLPAAFEMDEILFELKEHIVGLNCGRWDYIFSFIKTFRNRPDFLLPDRAQVVMGKDFLNAYSLLLIQTCHRRGAFAMGGMAAQIPVKNNERANEAAFAKVREDKEREALNGHDGTWVAHPALVSEARGVFDRIMPQSNQLDKLREDVCITQGDLLKIHEGTRTEAGLRENIRVGVQYIEAWLSGRGAVPLYNLMEDAATAEISRAQIWQWLRHGASLEDGRPVTLDLFEACLADEMTQLRDGLGDLRWHEGRFEEAVELFRNVSTADEFPDFLTLSAYDLISEI